jgi:transcriptional regulator with XRE-family HTH domain
MVLMPCRVRLGGLWLKRTPLPWDWQGDDTRAAVRDSGGMAEDELAACLRTWRDRLSPADVGLPPGGRRRAPGLRREELAQLAGLSVDYLARLEQGRASHPSPSVLAPLARALRLTDDERAHLFRVAGQVEPSAGTINRHLTPSVQRVIDRLGDVPVMVIDAAYEMVAANALAIALVGDKRGLSPRERNIAWAQFTGVSTRFVRSPEESRCMDCEVAADLREALGRYPQDTVLRELIDDLRAASPNFVEVWEQAPVAPRTSSRKAIDHPEVGRITVDCDILQVRGSDLRLIVYTAPPGTPDAQALQLLGAIGTQSFSAS